MEETNNARLQNAMNLEAERPTDRKYITKEVFINIGPDSGSDIRRSVRSF